MRKFVLIGAMALMLAQWVIVENCQAQRRMGGFGRASMSMLLRTEAVQEELGLSDEQIDEVRALMEDLQMKMREKFEEAQDLSREEIQAMMEEVQAEIRKAEKELLGDLLEKDQLKRLKQLVVQQLGPRALSEEDIVEALGISDEQKDKINQVMEESRESMMEKFQELREAGDREAIRAAMDEFQEKLAESLMGVLSDKQKEKLEELKGEKFDFPQQQRRRDGAGRTDF